MMTESHPSEADTWLRHIVLKTEICPNRKGGCGIWHYALTRSREKYGKVEMSGRLLSLIADGIEAAANVSATRCNGGRFRGIVFETICRIGDSIGDDYSVIPDQIDDDQAHANLSHRHYNNGKTEVFSVSAEVIRLHNAFTFAAPGSEDLLTLEARAGVAV